MPEPVQEEPQEVEVVHLSDDDEEDVAEEDEPIPPLGWTIKAWYKLDVNPLFHITYS